MVERLVFLFVLALLLFALVVGLFVLRDVFVEGVERVRSNRKQEPPPDDEQVKPPKGPTPGNRTTAAGQVVCGNCGEENAPEFNYCEQCATKL